MRRAPVPPRDRGFSLVELLAALALIGLVSALVTQSFGFGARIWERNRAQGTSIDLVLARLGPILEGAVLTPVRQADFSLRVPFITSPTDISFLSYDGGAGLGHWHVTASEAADGWVLRGHRQRAVGPATGLTLPTHVGGSGDPAALFEIRRLDAVSFAFAPAYTGTSPAWRSRWTDTAHAPALVRIHLERGSTSRTMVTRLRSAK